jgi:hypothetical protein
VQTPVEAWYLIVLVGGSVIPALLAIVLGSVVLRQRKPPAGGWSEQLSQERWPRAGVPRWDRASDARGLMIGAGARGQ